MRRNSLIFLLMALVALAALTGCDNNNQNTTESVCGNEVVEKGEECDGAHLEGKTCEDFGYSRGTLSCSNSCRFDFSGCIPASCGDGNLDPGEECDGEDLNGKTCEALGYEGGELGCRDDCRYDLSGCLGGQCGNGVADSGEECDGTDLAGKTCESFGYSGGTLRCYRNCAFNFEKCEGKLSTCGNGHLDDGEECDGWEIGGGRLCDEIGFDGGDVTCTDECKIDTSHCWNRVPDCGQCNDDGNECTGTTCLIGRDGSLVGCEYPWEPIDGKLCAMSGDGTGYCFEGLCTRDGWVVPYNVDMEGDLLGIPPISIAVTRDGTLLVVGSTNSGLSVDGSELEPPEDIDAYFMALDPSGGVHHATLYWQEGEEYVNDLVVGSDDSIYAIGTMGNKGLPFPCGTFYGNFPIQEGGFLAKLRSDGTCSWLLSLGDLVYPKVVDVDGAGNVYVAGDFEIEIDLGASQPVEYKGFNDSFVMSVSPMGTIQWGYALGSTQPDALIDMAVSSDGVVYVAGLYSNTYDVNDNDSGLRYNRGDGWSNPIIQTPTSAPWAYYILQIRGQDMLGWVDDCHPPQTSTDYENGEFLIPYKLSITSNGLIVGGVYQGTTVTLGSGSNNGLPASAGKNLFVAKLTFDGEMIWNFTATGSAKKNIRAMDTDPVGNVYVAISLTGDGDLIFPDSSMQNYNHLPPADYEDIVLVSIYGNSGLMAHREVYQTTGEDRIVDLKVGRLGWLYLAGSYYRANNAGMDDLSFGVQRDCPQGTTGYLFLVKLPLELLGIML